MQLPSPGLFTVLAACFGLSTDTAGASAPAYLGYERTALRSVHGHTNEAACGLIIMSETIGYIHSTESFGAVDGPGLRFIVFLQGCYMRCKYCHNPETWNVIDSSKKDEEIDKQIQDLKARGIRVECMTPSEVLKKAVRFKTYWKNGGGITVSGGEALLQIDFVTELFTLAKKEGINTALDTSGNPFKKDGEFFEKFKKLCEVTDLFILDLKHIREADHKELTGQPNDNILDFAKYLSDNGKKMWIRQCGVYIIKPANRDYPDRGQDTHQQGEVWCHNEDH